MKICKFGFTPFVFKIVGFSFFGEEGESKIGKRR